MNPFEEAQTWLRSRKGAYLAVFQGPRANEVLKDLARFCRAHESTADSDPYVAARLEGRREVFLRIQQHTQLTNDQLWQLLK